MFEISENTKEFTLWFCDKNKNLKDEDYILGSCFIEDVNSLQEAIEVGAPIFAEGYKLDLKIIGVHAAISGCIIELNYKDSENQVMLTARGRITND